MCSTTSAPACTPRPARRCTARPGVSDLDLCLILQHPATPQQLRHLEQLRQALQARHPQVSKIDFDIGHLAQVLAAENLDSWGYWLKHHCRCLSGEDLRRRFAPFRPSREIALAVNGDFQRVLDDYAERIEGERQPAQILRLQREASRKLIRATHLLRAEQEPSWPHSLDEHVRLFVQRYPDMAVPIAEFRQTAEAGAGAGAAASAGFSRRLRQMVQWMAAEHIRPRARN
nr:nucleotidyltransferase domain-containing protein [Pseudomonas protegens]